MFRWLQLSYKNYSQEHPAFHSSFFRMSHAALHQLGDAARYFTLIYTIMNMKKVLIILVVILTILGGIRYMQYRENRIYENEGQVFIDKIERYRSIHKRLPNNLESLGEKETMSTGPYYEKVDSNTYKLYFCIGFDDYKVYNSKDNKWSNGK